MANATGMAPSGRLKLVTSGRILDAAVRSRVSYLRWRPKRVWASSGPGNYAAAAFFAAQRFFIAILSAFSAGNFVEVVNISGVIDFVRPPCRVCRGPAMIGRTGVHIVAN